MKNFESNNQHFWNFERIHDFMMLFKLKTKVKKKFYYCAIPINSKSGFDTDSKFCHSFQIQYKEWFFNSKYTYLGIQCFISFWSEYVSEPYKVLFRFLFAVCIRFSIEVSLYFRSKYDLAFYFAFDLDSDFIFIFK